MTGMDVRESRFFALMYERLPGYDQKKIDDFIEHVETQGLQNLKGSFLKSDRTEDQDAIDKAQVNNLWHYHVGIPSWNTTKGYGKYKSRYYLHVQRFPNYIRIVGMDDHKPFTLPTDKMMEKLNIIL